MHDCVCRLCQKFMSNNSLPPTDVPGINQPSSVLLQLDFSKYKLNAMQGELVQSRKLQPWRNSLCLHHTNHTWKTTHQIICCFVATFEKLSTKNVTWSLAQPVL